MEIHRAARRHGVSDDAVRHATDHAIVVVDLEPDSDPPKQLAVGPDEAGNMLEVIVLILDDDRLLAIHDLLPRGEDSDG